MSGTRQLRDALRAELVAQAHADLLVEQLRHQGFSWQDLAVETGLSVAALRWRYQRISDESRLLVDGLRGGRDLDAQADHLDRRPGSGSVVESGRSKPPTAPDLLGRARGWDGRLFHDLPPAEVRAVYEHGLAVSGWQQALLRNAWIRGWGVSGELRDGRVGITLVMSDNPSKALEQMTGVSLCEVVVNEDEPTVVWAAAVGDAGGVHQAPDEMLRMVANFESLDGMGGA